MSTLVDVRVCADRVSRHWTVPKLVHPLEELHLLAKHELGGDVAPLVVLQVSLQLVREGAELRNFMSN